MPCKEAHGLTDFRDGTDRVANYETGRHQTRKYTSLTTKLITFWAAWKFISLNDNRAVARS